MKNLLALAAISEAIAGLLVLVYPPLVVKLLLGAEISGAGVVMSRIARGFACWPGDTATQALCGMLIYSALTTVYLISRPGRRVVWKTVVASRCYSHGSNNSSCSGVAQETKEPEGKHVDQEGEVV